MVHTEEVHIYFGIGLALMGGLALVASRRPPGLAATLWPIVAFLLGLLLFIPVEAHTRTYTNIGWWATFKSAVPQSPSHWLRDWWKDVQSVHAVQHKLGGLLTMCAGVVELGRTRGWLTAPAWGRLLPWLLIVIGLAFGIHGGTMAHLPLVQERVHHWIMGAGFVVGGTLLALHQSGVLPGARWGRMWAVIALLVGIEIALFYRIPPEALPRLQQHQAAMPAATGA